MFNTQKIKVSDVVEVESALRAILRARYPEVSAERGSVLNDLVIISLGYLAAAIKTDADQVRERLYLADLQNSDAGDSFQLLEDLASNFLVSTVDNPPKRGMVTFRFTTDISRVIPADITLSRSDNFIVVKLFDTTDDISLSSASYIPVVVGGQTFYEYSTLMESVRVADDVTITAGVFESSSPLIDLDSVFNTTAFIGLSSTEYSTKSLVGRIEYAQVARNFTTRNGIRSVLLNEGIPNLIRVIPLGASDPEMLRDVIPSTLSSSRFHSLGMINIVIASRLQIAPVSLINAGTQAGEVPLVGIRAAVRSGTDLTIVSDFGTVRYSKIFNSSAGTTVVSHSTIENGQALDSNTISLSLTDEDSVLLNGSSESGKFTINYADDEGPLSFVDCYSDSNLPVVQGLAESELYSSLATSTEVIGASLVQVIIPRLSITLGRGINVASLNISRVKRVITELVNLWDSEDPLAVSTLMATLSLQFGGIASSFTFVGGLSYILYLPDGGFVPFNTSESLSVEDDSLQLVPGSIEYDGGINLMQISNRVLNYYIAAEDINIGVA